MALRRYLCYMGAHLTGFLLGIVVIAASITGIACSERITHLQKKTGGTNWYPLTRGRVISAFVVLLVVGFLCLGASFAR